MLGLKEEQLDWLCEKLPDAPVSPKGGRPRVEKRRVIAGIFWILDSGAKWKNLPSCYGAKSTVHRWFKEWVEAGCFEKLMKEAGKLIQERSGFKLYECFIDGTFSKAKGGGEQVGCTKSGKGVKIMIMVDAKGLPVAAYSTNASTHENQLVQKLFQFMIGDQLPKRLIGDKAYDSDPLDKDLQQMGVEMIAPNRKNRRPENITQDGRPLRRYQRRWIVERTIGWLQHFRRLCIRWERSLSLFQAFLHFGCAFILLKQVLG
jgi:transposase